MNIKIFFMMMCVLVSGSVGLFFTIQHLAPDFGYLNALLIGLGLVAIPHALASGMGLDLLREKVFESLRTSEEKQVSPSEDKVLSVFAEALRKIERINLGPDKASGEWRCQEAAAIAAEALSSAGKR
ncbi:MAG: hypothetical protein ING19_19200 [Azospirillum sp.]|nr:hypothetical protein [Azospirillum sp.]